MAMNKKPRFEDLSPAELAEINNGVGPTWLPAYLRQYAGKVFAFRVNGRKVDWYPPGAQIEHDFGYSAGGDVIYRHECDMRLLKSMQENFKKNLPAKMHWQGLLIADASYILLRFHGVSSFYFYGKDDPVPTLEEVIKRAKGEDPVDNVLWKKFLPLITIPLGLATLLGIAAMFSARQILLTLVRFGQTQQESPDNG
ncbi:MAG: hypothetical protein C0623_14340 [Desulfuromonas sp.]|nr:MAG: hypothetical protein C0623_14340 [Desulfuromonas sp.]